MVVTNDGKPFGPDDWARLKSIASGNPDEDKIGAFGVGFYSVFGETEAPVVVSADQALAFYWKGNALMTRKMKVPEQMQINSSRKLLISSCYLINREGQWLERLFNKLH